MSEEALDYIRSSMSYSFQASSLQTSDFLESNSVFDQFDPITGEEVKNSKRTDIRMLSFCQHCKQSMSDVFNTEKPI